MFRVWSLTFSGINHPEVSELMNRPHPRFSLKEAELKHHPLDTIVMQYTGLKDKNNKEIYEGDVVKTPIGTGMVFDRLGCWFIEGQKELGYFHSYELEVVGNIYENPELLNREVKQE